LTVQGSIELQRRLKAIGDTQKLMSDIGKDSVREAKRRYHREVGGTGATQRSIELARTSKTRALITAGGAAGFIERGTRPHRIEARRRKALRFVGKTGRATGQARLSGTARRSATDVVFIWKPGLARGRQKDHVNHPGTKKNPILQESVKKTLTARGIPRKSIVTRWDSAA
jgi:hypothetical protein